MILAWLGPWQAAIIVVVLILFFGGKRFGATFRSLKRGGEEFKRSITEGDDKGEEPRA